jgi:uncharacterized phage protein gp47/JayE
MPWETPTLSQVRALVRDSIHGSLPGSDATIPNSVLRVLSDSQGALCFLTLEYVDWLALQLLPDTAETEWLDRHGDIWLTNSDGTTGRKMATLAQGVANFTGTEGVVIPQSAQVFAAVGVTYETLELAIIGTGPTPIPVRALNPGIIGNVLPGTFLTFLAAPDGVDGSAIVAEMSGGTDTETDDELRMRVLLRIRNPPMGGAQHDYVQWMLAVPGVTRAWCEPLGMGPGTVICRFLMDDLRADNDGWPTAADIQVVSDYLDTVRPVAVKDIFVVAPIKFPIEFHIAALTPDNAEIRAQVETSVRAMLYEQAAPGQTIYASWKSYAVMNAPGVESFRLINTEDDVMPGSGYMALLGDIYYET